VRERTVSSTETSAIIHKPGCTAADGCLLVHSYLINLAEGKQGYGVLQIGAERMEEGARAADQIGQRELAQEMRQIAQELPNVHEPGAARALAQKLKPLADQAWDLGRRCKGDISAQELAKARALARQVRTGEITMDEAVKQAKR